MMGKTKRQKNGFMGGTYMKERVEKPATEEWLDARRAEKRLTRKLRKLKKK
ncbi:hypothetical protein [Enterococcus sp. AZ196]|uniref:hypothetical protein n=1 Tax=Enterococcus sp. AZ196 TaxID=2774659 RepID=UPI003D2B358F